MCFLVFYICTFVTILSIFIIWFMLLHNEIIQFITPSPAIFILSSLSVVMENLGQLGSCIYLPKRDQLWSLSLEDYLRNPPPSATEQPAAPLNHSSSHSLVCDAPTPVACCER